MTPISDWSQSESGAGIVLRPPGSLFTIFFQGHSIPPQISPNLSKADVKVWRLRKKSAHGTAFLIRSRILSMLKVEGSRLGRTSGQYRGVDTGALGRRRTEYGATTV